MLDVDVVRGFVVRYCRGSPITSLDDNGGRHGGCVKVNKHSNLSKVAKAPMQVCPVVNKPSSTSPTDLILNEQGQFRHVHGALWSIATG